MKKLKHFDQTSFTVKMYLGFVRSATTIYGSAKEGSLSNLTRFKIGAWLLMVKGISPLGQGTG